MEIKEYLQLLLRYWWAIILGVIVTGSLAFFISISQKPVYEATSELLVSESSLENVNNLTALNAYAWLAGSYVERLKNVEVLDQSMKNVGVVMDVDDLSEGLSVSNINNTQLIRLSVEHTNPVIARDLANEIPKVFSERNNRQQLSRFSDSKLNLEEELTVLEEELASTKASIVSENNKETPEPQLIEQLKAEELLLRDTHSRLLQSYEEIRVAEAKSLSNLIVDDPARLPDKPVRPNVLRNTILGLVVGGMLALGVVFLVDYLDNTVKSPHEIEDLVGLASLGGVENMVVQDAWDALVMVHSPRSPMAETYRQVRTNLQYSTLSKNLQSILVTSANAGEGKSTTAANLALALVQTGKSIILVDADMRRPTMHKVFQMPNGFGLMNLIIDGENDAGLIQDSEFDNLRILTTGPLPPNPAELLNSGRMEEVLVWLQSQADLVIIDSPPILAVTDGSILSRLVSTTIFVLRSGKTTEDALVGAIEQLQTMGGENCRHCC